MDAEYAWGVLKQVAEALTRFGLIDILLIVLVLVGLLHGYRRGFSVLLMRLLRLIFITTITIEYTEAFVVRIAPRTPILTFLAHIFAFVALLAASWYVGGVLLRVLGKILTIHFADLIEKIGGALMGISFFTLLLSLVTFFLLLFPGNWARDTYEKNNVSGPLLIRLSTDVHHVCRGAIPAVIQAYVPPKESKK